MQDEMVVVVAGGGPPRPEAVLAVPLGARVIAADRGLEHARAFGLDVDLAVGDFDSASADAVAAAEAAGTGIERHPVDKDATDLELALDAALALAPAQILVLGGDEGRLDHLLSMLLVLGLPRYAEVPIDARIGRARVHVIRGERVLEGVPGELISLFALHGEADVRTQGLAYALAGETLEPGTSRGVSNTFASDMVRIVVGRGVVLAVRPGPEGGRAKWL
jgi:thiamine pyrophosphokinase